LIEISLSFVSSFARNLIIEIVAQITDSILFVRIDASVVEDGKYKRREALADLAKAVSA
jgi:hypothetical protein